MKYMMKNQPIDSELDIDFLTPGRPLQHTGCTAIPVMYRYITRYELNARGPQHWPNGPFWAGPEKSGKRLGAEGSCLEDPV